MRLRPSSLLWTFTGAFLVVLLIGTLLQSLAVITVVRPLARRWVESQGKVLAAAGAEAVGRALESTPARSPDQALASVTRGQGVIHLVWLDAQGQVEAMDRRFGGRRDLASSLSGRSWSVGDTLRMPSRRRGRRIQPAPEQPAQAPGAGSGERPGPGPGFHLLVVGVAPVDIHGERAGTIIAFGPAGGPPRWPSDWPRPGILYWPVAALLAGAAGFVIFRILARRLRRLEEHTGRVAAGDLSARIPDPGGDEVGRLARSLNRMTENLESARNRVEEAELQRKRFLADVTHELSTPLTTIRGYAETLLDPQVPVTSEEREQYLRDIVEEARRMDLLVADLLDLARLEAGAAGFEMVQVDWAAVSREATRRLLPLFRDAGILLEWTGPEHPVLVRGDARRLEQVLVNLLLNARRHASSGGRVVVSLEEGTGESGWVRLSVEDDGPGFSESDLPHVFDRFFRGDPARSAGGSGLGLAIVKGIVESHGGKVHAENRSEGGARVSVELPFAA